MASPISAIGSGLLPLPGAGAPAAGGPGGAAFADTLGAVLAEAQPLQPGAEAARAWATGRTAEAGRARAVTPIPSPFAAGDAALDGLGLPGAGGLGGGLRRTLDAAIAEVQQTQQAAAEAARAYATGRTTDVTSTLIAVERASVTFQLMVQIRNRLLEAYQELQRLQV